MRGRSTVAGTPSTPGRLGEAQRTARLIVVDAVPWLVYELAPSVFDRRNAPSLVFESDQVIRLVRNFPSQWRTMRVEELFALSWTV